MKNLRIILNSNLKLQWAYCCFFELFERLLLVWWLFLILIGIDTINTPKELDNSLIHLWITFELNHRHIHKYRVHIYYYPYTSAVDCTRIILSSLSTTVRSMWWCFKILNEILRYPNHFGNGKTWHTAQGYKVIK